MFERRSVSRDVLLSVLVIGAFAAAHRHRAESEKATDDLVIS
jgi:hypothetical protein